MSACHRVSAYICKSVSVCDFKAFVAYRPLDAAAVYNHCIGTYIFSVFFKVFYCSFRVYRNQHKITFVQILMRKLRLYILCHYCKLRYFIIFICSEDSPILCFPVCLNKGTPYKAQSYNSKCLHFSASLTFLTFAATDANCSGVSD